VSSNGFFAAIGDSITIGSGGATWFGFNYHTLACLLSGGRMRPYINAGVAGNTTAQMLARIAADVVNAKNPKPGFCIVLGGTNDVATTPTTVSLSNLAYMYDLLLGAGIEPIGATIPPRATNRDRISALNAGIRTMCHARGMHCLGFHELLTDPATGLYKAGYSIDGVHPVAVGVRVMADAVNAALLPLFPVNTPVLTDTASDAINMVVNGLFMGDDDNNGVANGWAVTGSGGTVSLSIESDDASMVGNWQRVDWNGGARTVTQTISPGDAATLPGWAVGDVLELAGLVTTEGIEIGGASGPQVRVYFSGVGTVESPIFGLNADVTRGVFYRRFIVPPGTTGVGVNLLTNSAALLGTGTVKFARLTMINLTRLGLT
jgi:lysophospholipase L1-like esterase